MILEVKPSHSRQKRSPFICYPWRSEEHADRCKLPAQTTTEPSRHGSLPPPYQQPYQNTHRILQTHSYPSKAFQLKYTRKLSSSMDMGEKKFYTLKMCKAFYWSLARFAQNFQFAGMIAAFANSILANIYAYFSGSLATAVLLPAVLVVIPNVLTSSGSLVAGIDTADSIVTNRVLHLTEGLLSEVYQRRDFEVEGPGGSTDPIVTAAFGMAQASLGITVGLYLTAFVVWPFTRLTTSFLAC